MFVYIIVIKNAITCSSSEITFLFHFEDNSQTCFNRSPPTTCLLLAVTKKHSTHIDGKEVRFSHKILFPTPKPSLMWPRWQSKFAHFEGGISDRQHFHKPLH